MTREIIGFVVIGFHASDRPQTVCLCFFPTFGMQVVYTFVAPYFVYIINHFFGLFGSPVLLVIISHRYDFQKNVLIKNVWFDFRITLF